MDLKLKYSSNLRKYYLSFLELLTVLRKYPNQKRIMETIERGYADYEYDESMQYVVKKRWLLIDKKFKGYELPEVDHSDDE